jgi:D-beta-D-heptose 7-phosphate kinase/D-beta-D-heptose 1-phosphate adenosyltransferase
MSTLLDSLASWRPFKALVVGDFMLDRLVFGHADRLSNDAPVPVLHVQRTEERAGGSANVALDLAAMRGSVVALGVVGDDQPGQALARALAGAGVDPAGLVTDPTRPTTVKQSLIGLAQHRHAQKMFRLDYESAQPIDARRVEQLLSAFDRALPGADVVCLEDYHKGVCSPELCRGVIDRARAAGVPVLVDPANIADYSKYRGCATITPNRNEAQRATGLNLPDDAAPECFAPAAQKLLADLEMDAAVITLDRHGALLLERQGEARAVPTVARRVYDVTGAGDMVLAALAAARANGLDWFEAVRFANAAAGLEVEEFGVVPIPLERIHADILSRERAVRGKQRRVDELNVEIAALKARTPGAKVVFANGCFDVLHAGHVSLLRRAAALGDYLIVAVNDDHSVRKLKGPDRPVYPITDRVQLLGELECVNAVVIFGEDTPEVLVHAIKPDVLVKGAQYAVDSIPGAAFVQAHGGQVALLDIVEGRSTTNTLQKIRAR